MVLKEKNILCSPDVEGFLDYVTSIVNFRKYEGRHKGLLRKAIQPKPGSNNVDFTLIEAFKLIVHELTHYLDLTTTVWGVEFLLRRDIALSSISDVGSEAVDVSMLNVSEILMHEDLVKVHRSVRLENLKLKHAVTYSEKYGPMIMVHMFKHGDLVAEVPISMLSLLEANAVANEMFAEVKWITTVCGGLSDFHEQRIASRLDEIIKDPSRLEYNILHLLIKVHFDRLDFLSRLGFSVAIFNFTLNISGVDMSAMANFLVITIQDLKVGDALCNDLCRGMSRHVIAFKLVLLVYQYVKEVGLEDLELTQILAENPIGIIVSTLSYFGYDLPSYSGEFFSFSDFEYNAGVKLLRRRKGKFEPEGHIASMLKNRRLRRCSRYIAHNLREYKLPDLLLDDEARFKMSTRQRYNVLVHWEGMYEECLMLNKLVKRPEIMKKFHLGLDQWGPMQELRYRALMAHSGSFGKA